MTRTPKLIDKLLAGLPKEQSAALTKLTALADRESLRAYLVGGPVRDLLLGLTSTDLDVSIEGNAPELAQSLGEAMSARVVLHPQFRTATVRGEGWHIDLITARRETYSHPGAMPTVRASTISDDLMRRDITINSMALALNGEAPGKLLDPTGGRADLAAGLIRALHDRSFQDDATRILRAVRYEARFRFRLEEATQDLLQRDLGYLDTISPGRVHRELSRTMRETEPERALLRLGELGVLRALHLSLRFGEELSAVFQRLRERAGRGAPAAYWPLLTWHVPEQAVDDVIRRLAFTRRQSDAARALPRLRALAPSLKAKRQSELVATLDDYPLPAVWALAIAGDSGPALEYVTRLRSVRPLLRGDDLPTLGVRSGKAVGEVLARLRAAKLDGEVTTRTDEEQLVRDYLRDHE